MNSGSGILAKLSNLEGKAKVAFYLWSIVAVAITLFIVFVSVWSSDQTKTQANVIALSAVFFVLTLLTAIYGTIRAYNGGKND